MSAMGFIEVSYLISSDKGEKNLVSGVQVGRLAIRRWLPGQLEMKWLKTKGCTDAEYPWRVDHISTGLVLGAFATPEEAYGFADDISRFSSRDLTATRKGDFRQRLIKQLGKKVRAWQLDTAGNLYFMPYRQWLSRQ